MRKGVFAIIAALSVLVAIHVVYAERKANTNGEKFTTEGGENDEEGC